MRICRTLRILIVLAGLLAGCAAPQARPLTPTPAQAPVSAAQAAANQPPDYWPTDGWRSTTPEEQGIDSEKLADMVAHIQAEQLDLHSLLIVRNGYLVSEIYGHPYTAAQAHWAASETKSVVSALVGIAIQQGKIKDVHQSLWSLLPQQGVKNLDANKQKITLEDLLTMRSGLDCHENPPPGQPVMEQSENWVRFALDQPMAAAPGKRFNYCSEVSQVLSAALQQAVGMSAREYANQVLFPRIGIPPVPEERWRSDPQGVSIGGYELSLTPREMAKFGYLFLYQGQWGGQQVVPAGWVAASTAQYAQRADGLGFGYHWNIDPGGTAFAAMGRAGQNIFIYPALNMVVVSTAGLPFQKQDHSGSLDDFSPIVELVNGYILPAVKSDRALPANPDAAARLQAGVEALAQPRQDTPPLPAVAAKISGKFFTLEKNPLGWTRLALTFPAGAATASAEPEAAVTFDGVHQVAVGLDNLYRVSDSGYPSFPSGLRGRWVDDSTFVIDQVLVGMMTEYTYSFHFIGDTALELTRVEKYFGDAVRIQGALKEP